MGVGRDSNMRSVILIVTIVLITGCSQAHVSNTLYGTALGTLVVDWGQTRAIVKDPKRHEKNPILGPHPTLEQVDTYFPAIILGTAISYPLLKPSMRPYFYGAITLLESIVIINNFKSGLHINFADFKF